MYCKLFASLYQGTLRGKANEILVFTNLLAHCDQEGNVDKHPRAIADEIGLPLEIVQEVLTVLEGPDPESRTKDENGARIILLDDHRKWGWHVVNYLKYREIRNEDDRRKANREAQARRRARQAEERGDDPIVSNSQPSVIKSHHSQPIDKDKDKDKERDKDRQSKGLSPALSPVSPEGMDGFEEPLGPDQEQEDEHGKKAKLEAIITLGSHPKSNREFQAHIRREGLDHTEAGRPDFWEEFTATKWHRWLKDKHRWEAIRDWKVFVQGLDTKIESDKKGAA